MNTASAPSIQIDAWTKLKMSLGEDIDWIKYFVDPIEQRVSEIVSTTPSPPVFYEPMLIEQWFSDITSLIEQCFAYRKEARDLEISAVKAAVDHQQFQRTADDNEKLELSALALEVYDAQRAGNTMAADAFSKSTSDLAQGFAASMRANVGQANVALDNANARTILIKDKWQALRDQEAAYHARHISPGNAHNYLERYSRVLELYAQDVFEVLGKANALAGGLLGLYQRSTTPPKMEEPYPGFLDRLALWVRNEAQILDIAQQNEIQYTVIIPLAQPWKRDSGGIGIVSEEDILNTTQNSRPLKFNLSGVFKNQTRLRIRGVGLCFGTKPGEDTENWHDRVSCVRARATIHTPQLPEIQGFAKSRNRPPIVIGNVRFLLDDSQAEIVSGRCCANSAVEGDWTIYIEPFAVDADSEERNLYHVKWTWNTRVVTDFKLILKLASLPSESANSVFG